MLLRLATLPLVVLWACAAAAANDQIFTDGFDGPKWFIDADSDGYGDPAIYVHATSQPQGYVANALDCDDADQAIHPGTNDDPDANFIDKNCDGIDGDIARAIFVATSGVDGPSCGTQASPCHSPAFAITRLDLQHTQIYVQVGTYSGAFAISANAAFYGGYDATWQRGPATAGGPNAKFAGSTAAMGTHGPQAHAVYVPGGVQALLAEIEIDAPDTTATSNGNGANSYALYAEQSANVQLSRDRIVAATAADGVAGSPGVDAAQDAIAAGIAGGPGMEYSSACDTTSHGVGGAASSNSCAGGRSVVAGKGGDGGTMDTSCPSPPFDPGDSSAKPGANGSNAVTLDGAAGQGGSGGSGGTSCGPTQPGFSGAVSDGSGGLKGAGSLLIDGQWTADAGSSGALGDNGGGGGGGGGAGGCDTGIDSYGAGGGGGGAGGCAATGAGSGGGGGGGSFGVFSYAATVAIDNSLIVIGQGGSGGNGGVAGIGQPGGAGGLGGLSGTPVAPAGGNGGNGGRGGVAGGGGGGQGGVAFGIYSFNSTITNLGNTFQGGVAGPGGAGGSSAVGAGAGESGQDGVAGSVGACASESNC